MLPLNQIVCVDCVEGMAKLPAESIDLTVTSPPYDGIRKFKGDFDFQQTAKQLFRVTATGGFVVWNVADQFQKGQLTQTSFKQALYFTSLGFGHYQTIIWEKNSRFPLGDRYRQTFEYVFVFLKGAKPKNEVHLIADKRNKSAGKVAKTPDDVRADGVKRKRTRKYIVPLYAVRGAVWTYDLNTNEPLANFHSARFPLPLASDLIQSFSTEGDVVLDPFMGSGTTAVAARDLKRSFVGFEVDKDYWRQSLDRLDAHR